MDPKSTHHEQPTVRAVQNTASSRTLAGSVLDARSTMVSCTAPAISRPRMVCGDGERLGDLAEAPLGDAIHGASQQTGALRGQGFDACLLCHTRLTRQAAKV